MLNKFIRFWAVTELFGDNQVIMSLQGTLGGDHLVLMGDCPL
jgi:hypothetical protein